MHARACDSLHPASTIEQRTHHNKIQHSLDSDRVQGRICRIDYKRRIEVRDVHAALVLLVRSEFQRFAVLGFGFPAYTSFLAISLRPRTQPYRTLKVAQSRAGYVLDTSICIGLMQAKNGSDAFSNVRWTLD